MKNTRAKPHRLVRALSDRVATSAVANAESTSVLGLARMRKHVRDLRARARRAEQEASLLERAVDGALAMKILDEAPGMGGEDAATA